jgi:predicted GIY-YIG superfamily endonuclease
MEALVLYPCVYVLRLEDDCYYIGSSYTLNQRLAQHWGGNGAKWTRLHKPIEVVEVIYPAVKTTENETTKRYMEKFGADKVKGGSWCRVGSPAGGE